MARIRTLKPEIWQDEALGQCPPLARLLYVGLITQADDDGRFRAAPALVKAAVFPYDLKLGLATIDGHMQSLAGVGLIRLYAVREQAFGDLPSWSSHQKINRPTPSSIPAYEKRDKREQSASLAGDSVSPHGALSESSVRTHDGNGRDRKGSKPLCRESPPAGPIAEVWSAWSAHHPKSPYTEKGKNNRRGQIERALALGYDVATLVDAVEGNHCDPYCNGENEHRREYHDLELILRDPAHIEKYAALATNSNGHRREMTSEEFEATIGAAARAAGQTPGSAEGYELILARSRGEA